VFHLKEGKTDEKFTDCGLAVPAYATCLGAA
jgi:hypothetical protein